MVGFSDNQPACLNNFWLTAWAGEPTSLVLRISAPQHPTEMTLSDHRWLAQRWTSNSSWANQTLPWDLLIHSKVSLTALNRKENKTSVAICWAGREKQSRDHVSWTDSSFFQYKVKGKNPVSGDSNSPARRATWHFKENMCFLCSWQTTVMIHLL